MSNCCPSCFFAHPQHLVLIISYPAPCEDFREDSIRSKTLSQSRVEEVKNLTLDDYQAMLNIRPLEGEGVMFYVIIFCSRAKKNNWEWKIRDHNKGD
jgi:hypothetical protein